MFRLAGMGDGAFLGALVVSLLPASDPVLERDRIRLRQVLDSRRREAMAYFSANAANWDRIRSLHVAEAEVEAALKDLVGTAPLELYLDLGTGTGRLLELFEPLARQATGIDQSREMLGLARSKLDAEGLQRVQVRQGDIFALPYASGTADLITIHQVLHYLDDPARAIQEAGRVLKPGGRLLIADFAPHELEFLQETHAHRRLGIADDAMHGWLARAGLKLLAERKLDPPRAGGVGLTVTLWLAERPHR
jgi:ubiquinone/menaquinone biosynthesis C-methylase UbiE